MRLMYFVFALLCTGATASAQATASRTPATVLDFGQLYSTYSWEPAAIAELTSNLGEALAGTVMRTSTEAAWPAGIASLDGRMENRPHMAAYTVYYLTTVGENIAVLHVPADENQHMPADLRPAGDIYFILSRSAVEFKGAAGSTTVSTLTFTSTPTVSTAGFAAQLNQITQDFPSGFVNVTGDQIDEDEEGLMLQYATRVALDGAEEVYFIEDLLSASTVFHAEFPGSADPTVTLKAYRTLVRAVESLTLSCCGLLKSEEQVEGNRHSQTFMAYSPQGKLDMAYQNMTIEVGIIQSERFDAKGELVSDWKPVLNIYER